MSNPLHDAGYITTAEAARRLGVVPERIRQHARAGDIESAGTVGRTQLFTVEAVDQLLELRAERGLRVPQPVDVAAGELVDGDGVWPPLVIA